MAEFIYQMEKVRKAFDGKVILDDVTMGFFPGAKIGVVGPNGMGKSTLLKIMAGKEEVTNGDARLTPGYTVGLLEQEPDVFLQSGAQADDGEVAEIEALIKARLEARQAKDWAAADAARNRLTEMGIILEDGPQGTTWRRK